VKVKAISLSWFRGASSPVSLELDGRSTVIYGMNGSGKSSFVDALEYVIRDGRIEQLAHEYSGKHLEKAVPNTHKPAGDKAEVSIKFSGTQEARIEATENGAANGSGSMLAPMRTWEYRRTILRQSEVVAFIQNTKGEKYSALLPLLGLNEMEVAAENLHQLARTVESVRTLESSKATLRRDIADRTAIFGSSTDVDILQKIEHLHSSYCPGKVGSKDGKSRCADLKSSIEAKISQLDAEQKQLFVLRNVAALDIGNQVQKVRAASVRLSDTAQPFIAEKISVLQSADNLLNKLTTEIEILCPACGRSIQLEDFREHVAVELEQLGGIRDTFNERKDAMDNLCEGVKALKSNVRKPEVKSWRDALAKDTFEQPLSFLDEINADSLRASCNEEVLKDIEGKLQPLVNAATSASATAPPDVQRYWDDMKIIQAANAAFKAGPLAEEVKAIETLIGILNQLEQATREEIRLRSQSVIDEISEDIRDMWRILHPATPIENVHLYVPTGTDKAIDIGLTFFGKEQRSPRLTLSEGYRNSLGLCIFLAMAKREAGNDRPVFLDDVLVSMDREHRGMVVELLEKKFNKRQVVIFTHDRDWNTELRAQLSDGSWQFKMLRPFENPEVGISWANEKVPFDEARSKIKDHPASAGNDARKTMDCELAIIAEALRLKLPYLRFEKNDKRMAHEFLERLMADGKKCFKKRVEKEFVNNEEAIDTLKSADELLVSWGNKASHSFDIVPAEASKLIEACEKALASLRCAGCERLVSFAKTSNGTQCECGGLRWE
jgi:recombinational DNA repair ATPase RecF